MTGGQPHSPVRRGVAVLVGLGVVCPLLTLLVLQYWSLTRLEEAVPAAARNDFSDRLAAVAKDVQGGLAADLAARLDVPAEAIPVQIDSDYGAEELFRDAPPDFVRYYCVIGWAPDKGSPDGRSKMGLSFYDPKARRVFTDLRTPEGRAVIATFWRSVSRFAEKEHFDPGTLAVTEDDPRGRVVMRIVPLPEPRGIAATAVILDEADYRGVYLPRAVEAAFARHFTESDRSALSLVVRDRDGKTVYATRDDEDGRDEVVEPLPWAFADWTVAVRSKGTSYIQWARTLKIVNMSVSALMTAILLAALVLGYRASAREVRLSQMKADFVSNVSHELRTPLASIRALGELLKLGWFKDVDTAREFGRYIEAESTRLSQLINNILDFSKIESGARTYRFERVSVPGLVRETTDLFRSRVERDGFAVDYEPYAGELPEVLADADAVAHALMNLLDNAVKYSGPSKRIVVRTSVEDGTLAIHVIDFGVGIPRSEHDRIFERFHRVGTGLVHDVKGFGLGLSIVKHIVDAHGGRVVVDSEPGRGSRFTIVLPAVTNPARSSEAPAEALSDVAGPA